MIDLKQYGYTETEPPPDGLIPGRVTAVHKERYELITPYGVLFGRLKTGVYYGESGETFPTTGDFVWLREVLDGDSQVVKTLSRKSRFIRRDPYAGSLGMWDAEEGVAETFADIEALLGTCRFNDCRHQTEPGCAILTAINNGELSAERWGNYNSLKREALYAVDRTVALQEKWARNKSIAKWSRQMKKNEGFKR